MQRPVCTFVRVLRAGRLLDTPRHAARFVSLLPRARSEAVGGGKYATAICLFLFVAMIVCFVAPM